MTNTYAIIYNGKQIEVTASTSYEAQEKGAKLMNVKKSYMVTTVLIAKGNDQVIHSTAVI